jgi:tetratricopeptide (TPR) repeat protein
MVTPLLRLAENAARQGDYDGANLVLEEADLVALAPRQKASVAELRSLLAALTGNPRKAVEHFERQLDALVENGESFDAWIERLRASDLYDDAGRLDDVASFLTDIEGEFRPPLDFIPSIGRMQLELFRGNLDEAEAQCSRLEQGLIDLNRADMLHMTSLTMGVIERYRGRIDMAAELLEQAHDQYRSSVQQTFDASSTDSQTILVELARTQLLRGDPEAALAAVDDIRQSWPHHPAANLFAARSEAELGRIEQARESIARALAGWAAAEPGYPLVAEAEALAATLGAEGS